MRRASSGGPRWSEWSSGRRCGGCTSCAACRSGRSLGAPGCIATRSGGRLRAMSRRAMRGRRRASKLDPFKDEIHRLLRDDPKLPGQRVRELIAPLGFDGGKTIVDDYLREVRPLFAPRAADVSAHGLSARARSASSISGSREREIPVGHGQTRRGWVVVACLGYSRAGAGALIFSKQTPDLLAGIAPLSVVARRAAGDVGLGSPGRHPRPRRPPDARSSPRSAASCASTGSSASRRDPQAKGVVERLQGFIGDATSSPAARSPTSSTSSSSSTRGSIKRANARTHKTLRCRPVDRLAEEHAGDGAAAGACAGHRPALGDAGPARSLPALRHLRLLARPGAGRPARRGLASSTARSSRSRWTPASSPAATRGRSPSTGRSPRSSTPAR